MATTHPRKVPNTRWTQAKRYWALVYPDGRIALSTSKRELDLLGERAEPVRAIVSFERPAKRKGA